MTESRQPIASAGKETVPPMYSVTFSDSGVTDHLAYYVIPEHTLIGTGLHASAFEVEMLLPPTKVVLDHSRVQLYIAYYSMQ